MLWALTQEQLARTSFPLGELTKAEVRNIAEENALINTQAVGYSSPVKSAYEEMVKTDYEGISAYTPRLNYEKDEVFRYQSQKVKEYCATLWTKIKAEGVR